MKNVSSIRRVTASVVAALLPAVALAVNSSSEAYKQGHSAGKVLGYLFIGIIVVAVVRKFLKK